MTHSHGFICILKSKMFIRILFKNYIDCQQLIFLHKEKNNVELYKNYNLAKNLSCENDTHEDILKISRICIRLISVILPFYRSHIYIM